MFTNLEQREIFHLAFLRQFITKIKPRNYALKGGCNLRFFYKSIRYSEDMDIDIKSIEVFKLKEIVINILTSKTMLIALRPFNINNIVVPDIRKAKQTETVQRFKIHLITEANEDLFTKIEFSKRRLDSRLTLESIDQTVLYNYKQAPLLVSHYPLEVALEQKILALADRNFPVARDVLDLYNLLPQIAPDRLDKIRNGLSKEKLFTAKENLLSFTFDTFKASVCSYLKEEDRTYYERIAIWETIQMKVRELLSYGST